jgi:hypothetical protein
MKHITIEMANRLIFQRGFYLNVDLCTFETEKLEEILVRLQEIQEEQQSLWEELKELK